MEKVRLLAELQRIVGVWNQPDLSIEAELEIGDRITQLYVANRGQFLQALDKLPVEDRSELLGFVTTHDFRERGRNSSSETTRDDPPKAEL